MMMKKNFKKMLKISISHISESVNFNFIKSESQIYVLCLEMSNKFFDFPSKIRLHIYTCCRICVVCTV